jgi:hypothetical protein
MTSPRDFRPLPAPIFVLGWRAADTALVGAVLGRNPDAFGMPELNLFVGSTLQDVLVEMPWQRQGAAPGQSHVHGLLRALAYIYGGEQTIVALGMAQRWVLRRINWPTNRVLDELRGSLAPLRLVDKSSVYSQRPQCLQRIRVHYPDAFYVHVVDHPLTARRVRAGSARNRRRGAEGSGSDREEQMQWLEGQRRIADALADVPPQQRALLRMEDLIGIPRLALADLCNVIGLRADAAALAAMRRPQDSPFAGIGPVGANLGDDPAFLRRPAFPRRRRAIAAQARMLDEVAAVAAEYGYA